MQSDVIGLLEECFQSGETHLHLLGTFCRDERIKRDHIHAHRFRDASDVGANFA